LNGVALINEETPKEVAVMEAIGHIAKQWGQGLISLRKVCPYLFREFPAMFPNASPKRTVGNVSI
jgi:hypothetical protein